MYLAEIKLWNFRKYGSDRKINLDQPNLILKFKKGLNVLIGENDSGKTAVIDAIKFVLKTHSYEWITVDKEDFYKPTNGKEQSKDLRIELTLKGMTSMEAKNFIEWLGWEGEGDKAVPYLKLLYQVSRKEDQMMPSEVKAGPDKDGRQLTALARDYLKTTYLKPLRDAKSELVAKRNSRFSQILRGDKAFKGKDKEHAFVQSFENLNKEINNYFKGRDRDDKNIHSDQGGKELKDKIDKFISDFCGDGLISDIKASSSDLHNILEKLEIEILNRINPGLGTLNRLFMGTELVHISKAPWTGIRLGLIEELEAHLHPQAQLRVIESLQNEKELQLILTTHSPNLASKVKLENLIIFDRDKVFPMGEEYTCLEKNDYKFLEIFLDVTKSNMFFSRGLIFVEGWAEEILTPSIAKKMGINLTNYGVSVINIGSTAFERYVKIFLRKMNGQKMFIPISIVRDSDENEYEFNDKKELIVKTSTEEKRNLQIDEWKDQYGVSVKNSLKLFIAQRWTLEYALAESTSLNTLFKQVVKEVHTGTDWSDDFSKKLAEKLLKKTLNKTEIAYRLAAKIDSLVELKIEESDSINYLKEAIKYACSNTYNQ